MTNKGKDPKTYPSLSSLSFKGRRQFNDPDNLNYFPYFAESYPQFNTNPSPRVPFYNEQAAKMLHAGRNVEFDDLALTNDISLTRPRPAETIVGDCAAGIFVVNRHNLDIGWSSNGVNNSISDYPF